MPFYSASLIETVQVGSQHLKVYCYSLYRLECVERWIFGFGFRFMLQ